MQTSGKNYMKTFFLLFSLPFLLYSVCAENVSTTFVLETPAESVLFLEIADTEEERQQGLMFRKQLPEDHGMLFVFERERRLSFWMKNTSIPLSIAFLDKEGMVLNIEDMVPFSLDSVSSSAESLYAIELNRGAFARHQIYPGSIVEIKY